MYGIQEETSESEWLILLALIISIFIVLFQISFIIFYAPLFSAIRLANFSGLMANIAEFGQLNLKKWMKIYRLFESGDTLACLGNGKHPLLK